MRDVAAHAGVSFKTVSRVVNDEPGVALATREKVERSVAALRFERNDLARSLRPGHRTHTLGLVIEDFANPFFSAVTQGVDEVAQAQEQLLLIASTQADLARERAAVTALVRRRVDGLLLVPMVPDDPYAASAQGTSTVFIDRPGAGVDSVLVDNVGGVEQAVSHLVERGHRRIAFVGRDPGTFSTEQRLTAFRRCLAERTGTVDEQLIATAAGLIADAEVAHAESAVERLLALPARRRPTAILTVNNRTTVGVLHALRGRPGAPALVGFDEVELGELLGVTVVRTPAFEMGRLAAELVLERIHGRADAPQQIVVPTELVPRGSGEIAP
jgi:LacI family transcriptional regulator